MKDMAGYEINEKDIEAVIRYMEIHDPKNADREYAVQYLQSLQGVASQLARSDTGLAELLQEALKKPDSQE